MTSVIFLIMMYVIGALLIVALGYGVLLLREKYGPDVVSKEMTKWIEKAQKLYNDNQGPEKKAYVLKNMAAFLLKKGIYITAEELDIWIEALLKLLKIVWAAAEKEEE